MTKKSALPKSSLEPYRYQSPKIPLSAIRRYARRIAERFHPDRIILFGSYAYGKPHVDSDVDLLVVMPTQSENSKAVRIQLDLDAPFALDLLVRTPQRLERRLRDGNWFLREVVEKGKVLYEKRDAAVGPQGGSRLAGRANAGRRKRSSQ
jgi:predicted nucleotidyltransferase